MMPTKIKMTRRTNSLKVKYLLVLALMLCPGRKILRILLLGLAAYMGALLFPMTAYAAEVDNPRVQAAISGEVLRVEAQNGFYAVEAIFVNGTRFNFRVDSVLQVDLLAFDDSEVITVYAIDFAGNRSNTVTVNNPHYIGNVQAPPTQTQGIPVTPQQSNPFTPDGQASVLDNATNDDEKEFFTFQTPAGNVFFLVVDRQRGNDNVYFLNAVTEQNLIALAEQSGNQISGTGTDGIPVGTAPQMPDEPETDSAENNNATADTSESESGGNNGTIIFLIIAMAIAGGAGYYFKIVRPKQQAQDDDYADEDEEDLGEELEFEDEVTEADEDGEYFDTSDSDDSDIDEDSEEEAEDDR